MFLANTKTGLVGSKIHTQHDQKYIRKIHTKSFALILLTNIFFTNYTKINAHASLLLLELQVHRNTPIGPPNQIQRRTPLTDPTLSPPKQPTHSRTQSQASPPPINHQTPSKLIATTGNITPIPLIETDLTKNQP